MNLHGVTSPAFFGNRTGEREAGLFESLSRLPAAERPTHLLTSASVQAGSALMRELGEGPPLYATTSLGDDLLLFKLRANLPGRQASPRLASSLRAAATLSEELKKHGFQVEMGVPGLDPGFERLKTIGGIPADYSGPKGLPTAFKARYKGKAEHPVVGIAVEYDALRGNPPFHGCQHNEITNQQLLIFEYNSLSPFVIYHYWRQYDDTNH